MDNVYLMWLNDEKFIFLFYVFFFFEIASLRKPYTQVLRHSRGRKFHKENGQSALPLETQNSQKQNVDLAGRCLQKKSEQASQGTEGDLE